MCNISYLYNFNYFHEVKIIKSYDDRNEYIMQLKI